MGTSEHLCGPPADLIHNYKGSQMSMARGPTPAVGLALMLSVGGAVLAQPQPGTAKADDQRLLPYVKAGQLFDIGGRRINLHCRGAGVPLMCWVAFGP